MRYHYKKPEHYKVTHGRTLRCNHPFYTRCTLYSNGYLGLAVIQQRFNKKLKFWYWDAIDPWLVDDIYNQPGFKQYFEKHAKPKDFYAETDIYPTVSVRSIMWDLRMKPLERQDWEDAQKKHLL